MRDRMKTLWHWLIKRYVSQSTLQRRQNRMKLDVDNIVLPGEAWWLWTVLIGVGGTILYVVNREWMLGFGLGRLLALPLDVGVSAATDAFHATVAVVLATFPMLPVAILAASADPGERREIYYLMHASFKTLVFGNYPQSSSRTLRTKIVRNLLWLGDVGLAKVGASLAATTLGISLYSETQGAHHPFVTIGCMLIIYVLFLYPKIIRSAMAKRYRSHKKF